METCSSREAGQALRTCSKVKVKLWSRTLLVEVLKQAIIGKFIGKTPYSMIQVKDDTEKNPGDQITVGLRMQLAGAGVIGDATLETNEEALTFHSDALIINQLRHAVRSGGMMSEQRVPFSVRNEAKSGLVDWWAGRIDEWALNQLAGYTPQTDTRYTGLQAVVAPDANHQVWPSTITDDQSLTSSHPFSLSLIDKAVERAKTLTPAIRPIRLQGGDYYVAIIHPYQTTQLRTSTTTGQWLDIQKAAMTGGEINKNPIFTGALGMYNRTIIHEDSRIPNGVNSSTGAADTDTRRAIFAGTQAGLMAFGRDYGSPDKFKWVEELFDYENQLGVAAGLVAGLKKTRFNSADFATIVMSSYAVAS